MSDESHECKNKEKLKLLSDIGWVKSALIIAKRQLAAAEQVPEMPESVLVALRAVVQVTTEELDGLTTRAAELVGAIT